MIMGKELRLLVVENERLIALYIEDMVREAGMQVVGPAYTLKEAEDLTLSTSFDGAILDIHLDGGNVSLTMREPAAPQLKFGNDERMGK